MPTASTSHADSSANATQVATKVGIVESDKRSKTRTVVIPNDQTHPKYGKIIRKRTVIHIHDELNESHTGDLVEVASCRPMSKTKSWKLVRIIRKGASVRFVGVDSGAKS